ncbi:MAG: TniQ family protein [Burkholderiaceae bacterium]|jgi:hypothetical protein|nr:TniQ family protein [Burkholderiaceae bacterium]
MQPRTYLPGFYRNLVPLPDESFAGYILRLAERNGYSGVADVLAAVTEIGGEPIADAFELRARPSALRTLSLMATGLPSALSKYLRERLPDHASMIGDVRIRDDAHMDTYSQVCTSCLEERGYVLEVWDFAPVVACPQHQVFLRDSCDECGARLKWSRSSLFRCGKCESDLRTQPRDPAPEPVLEVSEDFAAMAPFRFRFRDGTSGAYLWDTMFLLAQLLARPASHWCHEAPRLLRFYRDLPAKERRTACEVLAQARDLHAYVLSKLGELLLQRLQHLEIPAVLTGAVPFARRFALAHGLIPEVVEPMFPTNTPEFVKSGAELHGGRPPVLATLEDVGEYAGLNEDDLQLLKHFRRLPSKSEEDRGFDIDDVLALKRFYEDELLSLTQISPLVGASIPESEVTEVARELRPDLVVAGHATKDSLTFLQQALMAACLELPEPHDPVHIRQLTEPLPYSAAHVVAASTRLLMGGFSRCRWAAPYTWASIELEREELEQLLRARLPPSDLLKTS